MQSLRSIIRVNECEIAVIAESCFHQHFVHCIDETFHGTLVGFLNFENTWWKRFAKLASSSWTGGLVR